MRILCINRISQPVDMGPRPDVRSLTVLKTKLSMSGQLNLSRLDSVTNQLHVS